MSPDYYGKYKGCEVYVSGAYIDQMRRINIDAVLIAHREIDFELEQIENNR